MRRAYSFFFHYNKPQSKLKGKPQISVHYRGKCFIVDNVLCHVPTTGKISKRQPCFVMQGHAVAFTVSPDKIGELW